MIGVVFTALLLISLVLRLSHLRFRALPVRCVVLGICIAFLFVPYYGVSIIERVRAFSGDLSLATGIISVVEICYFMQGKPAEYSKSRDYLLKVILLAGTLFYPLALGYGPLDPYSLGFNPSLLTVAVFVVAVWSIYQGYILVVAWLLLSQLAFLAGFLESDNLWDYLMDPVIFIYALSIFTVKITKYRIKGHIS